VEHDSKWMLDGGLVNPVPVSVCRAMGAEFVIAVNLNAQLTGRLLPRGSGQQAEVEEGTVEEKGFWRKIVGYFSEAEHGKPGFFDVIATSVGIMQDRIT